MRVHLPSKSSRLTSPTVSSATEIPGSGALYRAANYGHTDLLESLLRHSANNDEIVGAMAPDEWCGSSSNSWETSVQISFETAMYVTVRERQYEAVSWLREHRAKVDLEDAKGENPYDSETHGRSDNAESDRVVRMPASSHLSAEDILRADSLFDQIARYDGRCRNRVASTLCSTPCLLR